MWVRFWSGHTRNPVISKEDDFFWLGNRDLSDETLQSEARERVPQWIWDCDAMVYFGFDRLTKLPDDIKEHLVKNYEAERDHSIAILEILRSS